MLPNQKAAVDLHVVELVEAVEGNTSILLCYFQSRGVISSSEREVVESKVTSVDRLIRLLQMIKEKDSGWTSLLSYLADNNQSALALKLQSNEECQVNLECRPKQSALDQFSSRLAQYYLQSYAHLPTMGESPKHVKDVWVPLQIDGRAEGFLAADRIDHIELLNRLKSNRERNVALIKGDPGIGKTTLAKKIAYDWAISNGSSITHQFKLVLAVPLRYADRSSQFDQLAIDYFLSTAGGHLVKDIDKQDLIREAKQLGSQLLVILDGLDEYNSYDESSFKFMFAAPFQIRSTNGSNMQFAPPVITFKLVITSRPYACERANEEFFPLRFVILPLDASLLADFLKLYCQTAHGVANVTEYLKSNAELIIQVPLILAFVCFLADADEQIPTNMTSLYDSLVRQMLWREQRQGKLVESVNMEKWKESNVVKATARIAICGNQRGKFEFSSDLLEECHVTNDSFICGFLLHKFDFTQVRLMAEFAHRSIQEYFVALHCYLMMLCDRKEVLAAVDLQITNERSQVGRFFFGICSKEGRFDQLLSWLQPKVVYDVFRPALALNLFGGILDDCSSIDNRKMGQTLLNSLTEVDDTINTSWSHLMLQAVGLQFDSLSVEFKQSVRLLSLTKATDGVTHDWFLATDKKSPRLVVCDYAAAEILNKAFKEIDTFIWANFLTDISREWEIVLSQIESLPPVRTFVAANKAVFPLTAVTVSVRYGRTSGLKLTNFRFQYAYNERGELLQLLNVALEKLVDIKIDETNETQRDTGTTIRQLKVTVNDDTNQSTLILSLIQLSLLDANVGQQN